MDSTKGKKAQTEKQVTIVICISTTDPSFLGMTNEKRCNNRKVVERKVGSYVQVSVRLKAPLWEGFGEAA